MAKDSEIVPLSEDVLAKALSNLEIQAGRDENGEIGAAFPNAEAVFVLDDAVFTVRTDWNGAVDEDKIGEVTQFMNNVNSSMPIGKIVPNIIDGRNTVVFRHHAKFSRGVSELQLTTVLDAYFQLCFSVFDEVEATMAQGEA